MDSQNGALSFTFQKLVRQDVGIHITSDVSLLLNERIGNLNPDRVFIVCDHTVAKLYGSNLLTSIRSDFDVELIEHDKGENHKNLTTVSSLSNEFFAKGGTHKSCVVALGGGLTGNIAGFFASIAYRGIQLIHIPTTLLAQLDSAPDVKQSVNSETTKNAIGSYKAPNDVIIDPAFLATLSDRELLSGAAEALKHGFSQDDELVQFIHSSDIRNIDVQTHIIQETIRLKIEHWKNTPTIWNDISKVERLTHIGHTTGKILEMIKLDYLTHGEAISHGMVIEGIVANKLGHLELSSVNRMRSVLKDMNLLKPLSKEYSIDSIVSALYSGGVDPVFALLLRIGNSSTLSTNVTRSVYESALRQYFGETADTL